MYGFIFKFFGLAIALLVVFYSAANAFRKARRLDARILEHKRMQAESLQRGLVPDPYSELSELYSKSDSKNKKRRRGD